MKRGQIYYIESNHQEIGSEQRAGRPAVIVSNDKNNENSTTVEVVYMTTQPKNDLPTHVFIRSSLRPSTVLCEQIYSVSTERLGIPIVDAAEALTIHSPAAASAAMSASVSAAAPLLRTPELHPDVSVNAVPFPDVADIEEQLRRNLMKQLVRRTEV